jgi:hypothetical protein
VGTTRIHSSECPFARQWLAKMRSYIKEDSTKVSMDMMNQQTGFPQE